jgi:hypothetical protein
MMTFPSIISEIQGATGRKGADELVLIKSDVVMAAKRFKSVMRRPWSRLSKKTDTVADQKDYQLPRTVQRVIGVSYKYGDNYFPLIEVGSEKNWERLNAVPSATIGIPRFFYPKGKHVISIYPTPGEVVSEGLKVYFEARQGDLYADDYSAGTVTVTNGSTTLTHSAAGFTANMVGRYFHVTDGSDESWYQIVDYVNTSTLTLENYYEGISGSGVTFTIGVVPDIPEEYHKSIVYYGVGQVYLRRDPKKAIDFLALFKTDLEECKELYSSPTSNDNIPNLSNTALNIFDIPPQVLS